MAVNRDPLNHTGDHAVGTWVVRVQAYAAAQVVSEELRNQDFEGGPHIVWRVRKDCRDNVVKQAAVLDRGGDAYGIAEPLCSKLLDEVYLVKPAHGIAREQAQHKRIFPEKRHGTVAKTEIGFGNHGEMSARHFQYLEPGLMHPAQQGRRR